MFILISHCREMTEFLKFQGILIFSRLKSTDFFGSSQNVGPGLGSGCLFFPFFFCFNLCLQET